MICTAVDVDTGVTFLYTSTRIDQRSLQANLGVMFQFGRQIPVPVHKLQVAVQDKAAPIG